jgi:hypothetical protein
MNKVLCSLIFLVSALVLNGQQVFLESGKNLSVFDYKNSKGEALDNLYGSTHVFLEAGYRTGSVIDNLQFSFGLSYNGYGASGSDEALGNYFNWDANYLGINLGMDYDLFKKRFTTNNLSDLSVYIKTSISPQYLIYGTQNINNQVINLIGEEQFKYPFIFFRGGCGVSYSVTRDITAYFQYMFGKGFPVKSNSPADSEKLRIVSHNFGIGLFINLPAYKTRK